MGISASNEAKAQMDRVFKMLDPNKTGEIESGLLLNLCPKQMTETVNSLKDQNGQVKLAGFRESLVKSEVSKEALEIIAAKLRIEGTMQVITEPQLKLARDLADAGQVHLFKSWDKNAAQEGKAKALMETLLVCNQKYPGGLTAYISKAKELLAASKAGGNPFEGYTPEVPVGATLSFGDSKFLNYEKKGLEEIKGAAFVLVAGGLGERLGYGGIKVALPIETTTMTCYLEYYCQCILALQTKANEGVSDEKKKVQLPLAIMTSGDTHEKTVALLKQNEYFGMPEAQISIVKQDKVPALSNNDAAFALDQKDPFKLQTKPHGHGDVHLLLFQSGLAEKWASSGVSWIAFFQDTNGLVFNALPATIGVSKELDLEVNSLTVPRKPKEAVGAICRLVPEANSEKQELTINVEYNQLDALLKTTEVGGDVGDDKGMSPYPGNINILVFKAGPYAANLKKTHGVVPEFVNPKYADKDKTIFKKPTRLECMMQDYPRLCENGAKVGFTSLERWCCFSAVKNNVKDAAKKAAVTGFGESGCTGESDIYKVNRKKLHLAGVDIEAEGKKIEILKIPCYEGAMVCLAPSFAESLTTLKTRFPSPAEVKISAKSTLVLKGDITVKKLNLDGALIVNAHPGAKVLIDEGDVSNDGYAFKDIDPDDQKIEEKFRIRGYVMEVKGEAKYTCDKPGEWLISGGKAELKEAKGEATEAGSDSKEASDSKL